MKAKDLMIGDLVRVNRDGLCIKNGTIVKVLGIDGESKLKEKGLVGCAGCRPLDREQFDGGIWVDYLDTIPLTPEILEKNGFELGGILKNTYSVGDSNYTITIGKNGRGQCDIMNHLFHIGVTMECCGTVHELQHALRLCGIEKEIVL